MASTAVQLTRGALMAMSAGAGSMYVYVHGLAPSGLSASEFAQAAAARFAAGPRAPGDDLPAYLKPLADQLGELSGEVARMRVQSQYGSGFVYSQHGGWGLSWATVATAGGVGVLFLYMKGYSFADFAYATKAALAAAVEALETGIANLGAALETAKRELSYKLGLLEEQVAESQRALEERISEEVGGARKEIDAVGRDVKGVWRAQEETQGMVRGLESQMGSLESQMGAANDQLSTANRGIYLLCNVVAENMGVSVKQPPPSQQRQPNNAPPPRGASLYEELLSYTRSAVSNLRGSTQPQPEQQANGGALRLLSADGSERPSSALDVVPSFREMLSSRSFRASNAQQLSNNDE